MHTFYACFILSIKYEINVSIVKSRESDRCYYLQYKYVYTLYIIETPLTRMSLSRNLA